MDAVFQLDEATRTSFLQFLMHSTASTYICLWSYSFLPQANCLIGWDGCCNDEITQSGARWLFLEYRHLVLPLENNNSLVPGFAFKNYMPYIELGEPELQNRASHLTQRRFYREAGIKKAVFMGCRRGEIELGSPNVVNLNMEMEMRSFFPQDFSRQNLSVLAVAQPTDPNRPYSSSSSLRSLSTAGSPPDSYPMLPIRPQVPTPEISPSIYDPHQQAMQQALSELRNNIKLPTLETENAAITKAILAVLTSPSSSSSSTSMQQYPQHSLHNYQLNPKATAFKRYAASATPGRASLRAQSMMNRAILFYGNLNSARRGQQPRNLHHMLSERKRREKINESFDSLRSLLPQGTKKDRVSILTSTREYLNSLKAQTVELNRQNQLLESRLSSTSTEATVDEISGSLNETFTVRIVPVPESTSQQRIIDLRVTVRGETSVTDILIQLLEFLKLDGNLSLMSTDADTRVTELGSVNHVNLRFRIEGDDWDESTFHEAVRRLLADLAQ